MALRLRSRFSLTMLALALVPLVVTISILLHLNLARLRRSTKSYRLAVADAVAAKVRANLGQARAELAAVGSALARTALPLEQRIHLAQALVLGARLVDSVTVYDIQGQLVDTLYAKSKNVSAAPSGNLDEGTRGVARTEGIAYLATTKTKETVALPMVLPVYTKPGDRLYGYVGTRLDLEPLRRDVVEESKRRFEGVANRVWLVDQNLRIIAHADAGRLFSDVSAHGIFADMKGAGKILTADIAVSADYEADGEKLLGIVQPIPELGWGIVVEQPRSEAYAAIRTIVTSALVVGGVFALMAILIGLVMGRTLASPIVAVARAADSIATGDFSKRIETKRTDEVGLLAKSFNSMAKDLELFEARVVEETRIRTDLARYLSADLVEGVISRDIDLGLGGTRQHVVVLFADVVAFTPLVEEHEPEEVVAVLNELFTFLTEIVFRHGGIVDKFIGDSVMALFGVPRPQDDAELRAVRAADEMLRWLETGNVRWKKRLGRRLELAIGINAGPAVVGNVGSSRRMEYTVIGDTVNVAARLEALARPGQVLMTRQVAEAVAEEFDTERLGERQLAGRSEAVELHVLLDT